MKSHDGTKRAYYVTNKAWYWKREWAEKHEWVDEIMFGLYDDSGGASGEMAMRWYMLGDKVYPRLEVFDDAWSALSTFGDLLDALAKHDSEGITSDKFESILKEHGFADITAYSPEEHPTSTTQDA